MYNNMAKSTDERTLEIKPYVQLYYFSTTDNFRCNKAVSIACDNVNKFAKQCDM